MDLSPGNDWTLAERSHSGNSWIGAGTDEYVGTIAALLEVSLVAFFMRQTLGPGSIGLIYLLGVVILASLVGRGPALLAAVVSALFWDYFFLKPIGRFRVRSTEDAAMLGLYFVVSIVVVQLTTWLRKEANIGRRNEKRSSALYQLTRELAAAPDVDRMLERVVQQIKQIFESEVVLLLADSNGALSYCEHPASTYEITGPEQPGASLAFEQAEPTGNFSVSPVPVDTLFLPLRAGGRSLGVLGLKFKAPAALPANRRELLALFCHHIGLAVERHRAAVESQAAKLLAESERISHMLLNSIAHEIRTPLTAIESATSSLTHLNSSDLPDEQRETVVEIREAGRKLNAQIGKVLGLARLELGCIKPNLRLCDIRELLHVAVKEAKPDLSQHEVTIEVTPRLPFVLADFTLLQQAVANLVSNAAIHTPRGTAIRVGGQVNDGHLVLTVADRGPGIPPECALRIFDKFYRGPKASVGGAGLGLSLVKAFVEAQGGTVQAENREGGGAIFTLRLPLRQA